MKKIFTMAAFAFLTFAVFTACEDDRDSNPTLTQPKALVLNNPAVGDAVVDLEKSNSVALTWSQPVCYTDLGAPIVVSYSVQVSASGNFTTAYDPALEDNTGADYITLDESTTFCKYDLLTADVATALQKLQGWSEDYAFQPTDISLRLKAAVVDDAAKEYNVVYSNPVSLKVLPYYVELKDAAPIMWYLVGNMFGGKWGSDIGETALPMFLAPGKEYDKKTGAGEIQYLNYFITGEYDAPDKGESSTAGWKIQPASFDWNYGMTGDGCKYDVIKYRNGESADGGHIVASENGFYLVTLNTGDFTAKMEKQDITPAVLTSMGISGAFNGWTETPMLPYNKEGVENHAWYYVLTVTDDLCTDGVCGFKFRPNGEWEGFGSVPNAVNYCGVAGSGENLGLPVGKYCISYNDISHEFSIVVLQ